MRYLLFQDIGDKARLLCGADEIARRSAGDHHRTAKRSLFVTAGGLTEANPNRCMLPSHPPHESPASGIRSAPGCEDSVTRWRWYTDAAQRLTGASA
eukprot:747877-Hanusia_phi.AAC.5